MQIETIQSLSAWQSMATEWNALLDNSATNVPFLRHEYLSAWWQHKGGGEWPEDSQLYICVGRENGELRGIAPLFIAPTPAGKRTLLLLGSVEISDFLDFVVAEEHLEEFVKNIIEYLCGSGSADWDAIDFMNILNDSLTIPVIEKVLKEHALNLSVEKIQPAPYIPLPATFETYLEQLESKQRREFKRKMRNAEGFFIPVAFYQVEDPATLDDEFEAFTELMMQDEDKKKFLTPQMKEQLRAIVHAAFEGGYLQMLFVMVGREKAAGILNFDYDDCIWGYNSGTSEKHQQIAPGIISLGYSLEAAIDSRHRVYDLMRGDESYKYDYGAINRYVMRVQISRP